MAARFWRMVIGLQLALAAALAATLAWSRHGEELIVVVVLAGVVFVALQYLLVALLAVTSHLLAPRGGAPARLLDVLRMAMTEPFHFGISELAMASGSGLPQAPRAGSNRRGPLLLVHGFACNSAIWRPLLPRLRAAGFEPILALDFEPFRTGLDALAARVADAVDGVRREHGPAPVTLLAHSMGGLACRAALRELQPRRVRRLVTIATPHHGASIARLCRGRPVNQLRRDSPWLAALNAAQEDRLPVPVTSVFSLDDELVVPAAGAALGGARQFALRGLGHFGLLASRRAAAAVLRALRKAP